MPARLDTPGVRASAPELQLECSSTALDKIRSQAVNGYNSFRHGGLEIGGVLYGVRSHTGIHVVSSVELEYDHAAGPGFILTESDLEAFSRLLDAPAGIEAVGWYCSHTRSGMELRTEDRDLFDRFFPDPGAIVLIVKPSHWGPADAAFFVRGADGQISAVPFEEMTLEPRAASEGAPGPEHARKPRPEPRPEGAGALTAPIAREAPEHQEATPSRKRAVWGWLGAFAAVVAVAAALYWKPAAHPARDTLGLQAHAVAPGQMRIEWNPRSAPVLDAASGSLEIVDGAAHPTIPLDSNQLRSSGITYWQQSGNVLVRMRVEQRRPGSQPAEELIQFLSPSPAAASPPPERPPKPAVSNARIAAVSNARIVKEAPKTPKQPAPRRVMSLPPAAQQPVSAAVLPPPPAVVTGTSRLSLPDLVARPPMSPRPPVREVVIPARQVYSGPRSGRIIWTGSLGRRGVVEIEGSRPSIGSLIGALPGGVPVSFHIAPAEFGDHGLVIYTADSSREGRSEKPARANGWNSTEFQFDPERARELVVIEAPNTTNSFKRLVLRNEGRSCSVVVIDWSVK